MQPVCNARRNRAEQQRIERMLFEGQTVLVQVIKDPIGTKGARLSTQISLAGRFLVHLPQEEHIGISQKIENEDDRLSLKARLENKTLPTYEYKDYGSLVSLSRFSAVGNLMGNLMGSVKLEGWLARMFYVSLYRMHQMALYGTFRTLMLMLGSRIGRGTEPRLKLH